MTPEQVRNCVHTGIESMMDIGNLRVVNSEGRYKVQFYWMGIWLNVFSFVEGPTEEDQKKLN